MSTPTPPSSEGRSGRSLGASARSILTRFAQRPKAAASGALAIAAALWMASSAACSGFIIEPPSARDDRDLTISIPEHRVWRLTPLQYERSFVATFGTTVVTGDDFVRDPRRNGFDDLASQNHVDIVWAELVQRNAATVAASLASSLEESRPCLAEASPSPTCVGELVDDYGSRAFRRPVDPETRESLVNLFVALRQDGNDTEASIAGVLEAIAQSPYFLYRIELGEPAEDGLERLDSYTLASQLSYMLTDQPPDEELMADAESDQLLDRTVVLEHARRLLDTPEALQKVSRFFDQYLGIFGTREDFLAKDPMAHPAFTPEIQAAMIAETDRFVERIAFADTGTLMDVFASTETYVDDALREFYGWQGSASPEVPFAIPEGERAGIFMQGAVLATNSQSLKTDPLHRGLYIYERLLCQHIAPPAGVDIFEVADLLDPPDPESTERQRLDYLVREHPECGNCHTVFVSLGLSLENFDSVGRHRDTDNGRAIDPSGLLKLRDDSERHFAGAAELFEHIAQSTQGQACFAENWISYAFGGNVPVPTSSRLAAAFEESGLRIRDLLTLVTQEDAFYFRRAEEAQ